MEKMGFTKTSRVGVKANLRPQTSVERTQCLYLTIHLNTS